MARNSFESLSCYPAKQMKPDILHHVVYIVMTIHQEEASSNVFWLSNVKIIMETKNPFPFPRLIREANILWNKTKTVRF